MQPMFSPPLHRQRHQFVIDYVKRNKPRKVLDLGCGECSLLKRLKFHREVELLVGVDIDGAKVKKHMHGLAPISTDYLQPTFDKLRVELYQGSVTQIDARLRGFDLVTSVELIEHLTPADVEQFSEVVFGHMTPVAVIVSTPNSDFNPLLPGLQGFRHSDHKFEWTRAEFQSWAEEVSRRFGYEVEFTGVGEAPRDQQDRVGFCSQIAVFHRLTGRGSCNILLADEADDAFPYKLLYSVNYPTLQDNNTLRRVLVSEVLFWVDRLRRRWLEKKTDGGEDYSQQQTDREEERPASPAHGAEVSSLMEHCGWRSSEETEEMEGEEPFGKKKRRKHEAQRCVSVPLAVLWTSCPRVGALSGSLSNLRHLLTDDPEVKLNQDGSALLINLQEQDHEEEEEDLNDLEDSGYAEASGFSHSAEQEDDWDANV